MALDKDWQGCCAQSGTKWHLRSYPLFSQFVQFIRLLLQVGNFAPKFGFSCCVKAYLWSCFRHVHLIRLVLFPLVLTVSLGGFAGIKGERFVLFFAFGTLHCVIDLSFDAAMNVYIHVVAVEEDNSEGARRRGYIAGPHTHSM